ncbi:MAG TPA: CBS domain-containing protein [Thermomicrobiaceae bacterium]|nr:CBS domain-containing protein [Thermomicrobiaceae bacterium]
MADQAQGATIAQVAVPEVDTIRPEDPIRVARRRMESQTRRSLIVVQDDRPIGVVQWRDLMHEDNADLPVSDFMVREFPVVSPDMSLSDARDRMGQVDFDRIPVVDDSGRLVGEVPRSSVAHFGEVVGDTPASEPGTDPYRWGPMNMDADTVTPMPETATLGTTEGVVAPSVSSGMNVSGSEGKKLGTVDQVVIDQAGRLAAFTVKHGLLGRKHKRIPADLIDGIEGDTVSVSIGPTEFNMLADIED